MDTEKKGGMAARRKTLSRVSLVALFAALTSAGAFISIPLSPVPVVLQNLFAVLSGLVLGPVMGSMATGLYLIAGALGAPVFAGGTGGFVRFLGPTGGFLLGYLFAALTAGLCAGPPRQGKKPALWRIIAGAVLGMLVIYLPGLIQLKLITGRSWAEVFIAGFFPFLPGDSVKCAAAVSISMKLRRLVSEQLDS